MEISLFPFLSILACVIGILTLMITAIVIAQIDPEAVNEKIETALEDDEEFQKKIEQRKKELENLRKEIEAIQKDPFKKIDPKKKDQLKQQIAAVTEQIKKAKTEEKQGKAIQGEVVKMKADLAKMMKDLEQAEEEWELMTEPEKFATMVVKQSGSGAGGDLEPTFIECNEKGIRVYEEDGKHFEAPIAQINGNPKLKALIQKVAKEAPYRTWRSAQGSQIDARFVKRDGSKITLKDKKGKRLCLLPFNWHRVPEILSESTRRREKQNARTLRRGTLFSCYEPKALMRGVARFRSVTVWVVGTVSFHSMERARSTCPFLWVHEKKEKRCRW